jgi:hypothetical protein
MKLPVPQSDLHNQVLMTFRSDKWEMTTTLDDSHKTVEVSLPKGVNEDDVEVVAQFLNKLAQPDPSMVPVCVKQRTVKAKKPETKVETKVEPKLDEKPRYAAEGKSEAKVEIKAEN